MKTNLLPLDAPAVISSLTAFITDTVTGAGFSKVVLGISGGVDSALSAYLSARALGAENTLCLRLPYKTSSQETMEHSQLVIDQLGAPSKTIDISPAVDAVLENFPEATPVRRGNIMARMRMLNIYDQSAAIQGMVVGTGNKTESLLGYSTIHGDGAFDFNPLADLYKFQVRQLAAEIGVPEVIITKPPSADLWVGQTDEDEIGFTYNEIDQLFYCLLEEKLNRESCLEKGFNPALVEELISRVKRYRYKSLLPPGGSIGQTSLAGLENLPFYKE